MTLLMNPLLSLVNVSTICLSAFNKVPQIWSVVRARSVSGLSLPSVLLELTGYCITMSYFMAYSYSLPSYLEYPLLVAQDVILVLVVVWLGGGGGVLIAGYGGLLMALGAAMVGGMFSDATMTMLVTSCTPISAVSKLVQLTSILRNKSSEGIAVSAWSISAYSCVARIFTVYVATADVALLINFSVSLLLNISIIVATLYYAAPATTTAAAKKEKGAKNK